MQRLNRTYLARDYATDVLSFPAALDEPDHNVDSNGTRPPLVGRRPAAAVSGDIPPPQPRRISTRASTSVSGRSRRRRRFLGDIVIASPVAARQARQYRHSLTTELKVLALHGLLHLLGHDHERDSGEMARIERRWRRRGNLSEGLTERGAGR
jgi:ssRNA-specific RNase YbeY (16S rRNA maturation enzyme)